MTTFRIRLRAVAVTAFGLVVLPSLQAGPLDEWQQRYPLPTGRTLNGIAYGHNLFVAVGWGGTALTSQDGVTWKNQWLDVTNEFRAVTFGNSLFVAVGAAYSPGGSTESVIRTSSDGTTWSNQVENVPSGGLRGVAYGNGRFVAFGGREVLTSQDGLSWDTAFSSTNLLLSAMAYGNGKFVVVGERGALFGSADGAVWKKAVLGTEQDLTGVVYGRETFVVVGKKQTLLTSPDGVTWTGRQSGNYYGDSLVALSHANGNFFATGAWLKAFRSSDGINWVIEDRLPGLTTVTYVNGLYVAVGLGGAIFRSADAVNWTREQRQYFGVAGLAFGQNKFVGAAGDDVVISEDGVSWNLRKASSPGKLGAINFVNGRFFGLASTNLVSSFDGITWNAVYSWAYTDKVGMNLSLPTFGNGKYVAVGTWFELSGRTRTGVSLTSKDGVSWTRHDLPTRDEMGPVAFGDGRFVAAGWREFGGVEMWGSTNGATWRPTAPLEVEVANSVPINSIAFGNHIFVAVPMAGAPLWISSDGLSWRRPNSRETVGVKSVTFGDDYFLAGGETGAILVSTNGVTWTRRSLQSYDSWNHVSFGQGTFVVVGGISGEIFQSGIVYSQPRIPGFEPFSDGTWSITGVIPDGKSFRLESSGNLMDWSRAGRTVRTNSFPKFIDEASRAANRFYRLVSE